MSLYTPSSSTVIWNVRDFSTITNSPQASSREMPTISENREAITTGATNMLRSLYAVRLCILNRSAYICSEWLTERIVTTRVLTIRGVSLWLLSSRRSIGSIWIPEVHSPAIEDRTHSRRWECWNEGSVGKQTPAYWNWNDHEPEETLYDRTLSEWLNVCVSKGHQLSGWTRQIKTSIETLSARNSVRFWGSAVWNRYWPSRTEWDLELYLCLIRL